MSGTPAAPVLVVGAGGRVGGRVVDLLCARGLAVRALVRPTTRLRILAPHRIERTGGDLRDPASLAGAVDGVSAIVVTATGAGGVPGDTPDFVDDRGVHALVGAAALAGVRRIVVVTAAIADRDSPHELLRAKAAAEAHLAASQLDWTAVAPEMFIETWVPSIVLDPARRGLPVRVVDGAPLCRLVAGTDVAAAVVAALEQPWTIGRRLAIGGPEAIAWEDLVERWSRRTGRPIAVRRLSQQEAQAGGDHLALLLERSEVPHAEELENALRLGIVLASVDAFLGAQPELDRSA